MWIRGVVPILFVFSVSVTSWAKKEVVFFGGGGEPSTPGTIFDKTYEHFAPFANGSGWVPRSYFNGGHPQSEALAKKVSRDQNKPMTTQNIKDEIASLKKRILNKSLKSGDQVMLTLATHGLPENDSKKAHQVATSDKVFDLNELKELRDVAEKNGVRLAILDFSCHSGSSLALATDKTCVVSGASHNLGYVNAGEHIGRSLKPGTNLEEAFLSARMKRGALSPGAPQISTEAGKKAYELTKFLSNSMLEETSLTAELDKKGTCEGLNSSPYRKLIAQLRDIQKSPDLYTQVKIRYEIERLSLEPVFKNLEAAMKNYQEKRSEAELAYESIRRADQKRCVPVGRNELCGNNKQWEYGYTYLMAQQKLGKLSGDGITELNLYKEQIASTSFKKWKSLSSQYQKKVSGIYWKAKEVAKAERDVYQMLYEHFSSQEKKTNPCRSFVL